VASEDSTKDVEKNDDENGNHGSNGSTNGGSISNTGGRESSGAIDAMEENGLPVSPNAQRQVPVESSSRSLTSSENSNNNILVISNSNSVHTDPGCLHSARHNDDRERCRCTPPCGNSLSDEQLSMLQRFGPGAVGFRSELPCDRDTIG